MVFCSNLSKPRPIFLRRNDDAARCHYGFGNNCCHSLTPALGKYDRPDILYATYRTIGVFQSKHTSITVRGRNKNHTGKQWFERGPSLSKPRETRACTSCTVVSVPPGN